MASSKRPFLNNSTPSFTGRIRESSGLTLLELVIALLVLQIALVAFAQFITKALDYSRRVRLVEMAQVLAQAKMEEFLRTIPASPEAVLPGGGGRTSRVLNKKPGTFDDVAYAHSEDITPFRWVAEITSSEANPKLLGLTLYVYVIKKRVKEEKASEPTEDFQVSDDRKYFTYIHTLDDGSVEVMRGREKLRISTAMALP